MEKQRKSVETEWENRPFEYQDRVIRGCPRRYYPGSNLCIMRLIIDIFTQASLLNVVRS